jgi:lipoprotein-anchoring transpeptidase ErfK/SrfK
MAGVVAGFAALAGSAVAMAPAANASTAPAAPPCSAQARACLDLHSQTAWLMDHGRVIYGGVPVASGKATAPTPSGTFRVQYKDIDHYSKQFNGPMPYSVFFTNTGVAFHQGSLQKKSNGCVHLSRAAAVKFYNTLQPGDVVEVK